MRAVTRHSIVLVLGTGLTALLSITYIIYAGRVLGPERYADFMAIIALIYLCGSAMGPVNETMAKFSAGYAATESWGQVRWLLWAATRRIMVSGTIALVIGMIVSPLITRLLHLDSHAPVWTGIAAIYLLLYAAVARGALRGCQKFVGFSVNTVAEAAIRWIAGLALIAWCLSTTSALAAYVIALLAIVIVSYLQVAAVWHGHPLTTADGRLVRQFVLPVLVFSLCKAGFEHLDMLMVKHYFPEGDPAGLYGSAVSLSRIVSAVATPFGTMMIPMLAALHERGERLSGTFLRLCGYFILLISGPLVLLAWAPEWIMRMCFESEFAGAAPLLAPLSIGRVGVYVAAMVGLYFLAVNRFSFLYIYVAGLLAQTVAIVLWHHSLSAVVRIVLVCPWLTALFLALWLLRPRTPAVRTFVSRHSMASDLDGH